MNGFLITFKNETSEWLSDFISVQSFMDSLEKSGIVSNVIVRKFNNGLMSKEIKYNFNGLNWE